MWWHLFVMIAWGGRGLPAPAPAPVACPAGSRLAGTPPPNGVEIWCERPIPGGTVREGPAVWYHPNGTVRARGAYSDGRAHGLWTHYRANGEVESAGEMVLGRPFGRWSTYWPNGQVATRGAYVDGERHGPWELWSEDGARREVGEYLRGEAVGVWVEYGFDRPLRERIYRNGRVIAVRDL